MSIVRKNTLNYNMDKHINTGSIWVMMGLSVHAGQRNIYISYPYCNNIHNNNYSHKVSYCKRQDLRNKIPKHQAITNVGHAIELAYQREASKRKRDFFGKNFIGKLFSEIQ